MTTKKIPVDTKGFERYGMLNCCSMDKRWICRIMPCLLPLNSAGPTPRPLLKENILIWTRRKKATETGGLFWLSTSMDRHKVNNTTGKAKMSFHAIKVL
jgi:hypothetical protein